MRDLDEEDIQAFAKGSVWNCLSFILFFILAF